MNIRGILEILAVLHDDLANTHGEAFSHKELATKFAHPNHPRLNLSSGKSLTGSLSFSRESLRVPVLYAQIF